MVLFWRSIFEKVWDVNLPGKCIAIWRFNPRTGTKAEPNCSVFSPGHLNLTPVFKSSNNLRCTINKSVKELVHLCNAIALYIIIGSIQEDCLKTPIFLSSWSLSSWLCNNWHTPHLQQVFHCQAANSFLRPLTQNCVREIVQKTQT